MVWNKTITVFCSYIKNHEQLYKRKILTNTFYDNISVVATNQGLQNANKISLFIKDYDGIVPPREFNGNGWTLKEGDRIVAGEVLKDYTSMIDLEKDYVTYTITSVDFKNYGTLPHYEVGGR